MSGLGVTNYRYDDSLLTSSIPNSEYPFFFQDVFTELQVAYSSINGCRKSSVVKFCVEKSLLPYTTNRQGLLTKCTPINAEIAKKLLDQGYKHLSPFKKWCPVKVSVCIIYVCTIDIALQF